ncbi:hypothetical protein [Streptomyces longwoodensis]|uniref:hypothetical protein n=1 Tax=Streptomyces longwoodensis TaxID=68231 RepID=UPI0022573DE5|nr:hypothetical protein [Streptomyces longwoodensis]MCX4993808.1 hypothetical protein [Streptomyces longwoodensis]MCX4998072.1 hypothetical protein [Streptomyces longwoodensis]
MPSDHDVVLCDGCRERIRWAITVNGRRQAINADPDDTGNLGVYRDGTGTLKARALTKDRPTLEGAEWRAKPHAATCTSPRPRPRPSSRPGRRATARYGTWRWAR